MATVTATVTQTRLDDMGIFGFFSSKRSLLKSSLLKGSEDRHSHILYGVDDGVKTIEESLEILQYYDSIGIRKIWCTPHVMEDLPNTTEGLKARFDELCKAYKGSVKLQLAAEYMLDTLFEQRLKDRDLLTMEDDQLLVETSTMAEPYDLYGMLSDVMSAGYRPVLAHPERYRFLQEKDYNKLHEMGVYFQLNLASVTGYYGESARKKAEYILDKGWYVMTGSDCHRFHTLKAQHERKAVSSDVLKKLKQIM